MRAVTIAAAGAAVITTVSAASHVKHMHAKLHENVARDTWVDWNTTTTTTKAPVKAATTSTTTSFSWEDWTSSSLAVDPEKTSSSSTTSTETWGDWTSTTTSSKPVKAATTSSSSSSFELTWADWTSSSSLVVDPASTSTETWGDWSATSDVVDPTSTATETWADWTSSAVVDPASTSTETWGDWSSGVPVAPASTTSKVAAASTSTETWVDWTSTEETTTVTVEQTLTKTKYVEPVETDSTTWADWTSSSAYVAAASTSSSTESADACVVSIITSYGAPTWNPTPIYATNTTTSTSTTSSVTWADWTTSTTPAAAVQTSSSTTPAAGWASSAAWGASPSGGSSSGSSGSGSSGSGSWGSGSSGSGSSSSGSGSSGSGSSGSGSWGSGSSGSGSSGSSSSGSGSGSSGSGSSGSGSIHANGDAWGLTYSPYTAQGGCKDASTVAADLAVIAQKGFSSVRVYSTDCSTLQNIGTSARNNGLKLILGVWISSTGISGAQGQVSDIVAWAQWDLVELIVVGNEAVFNGYASAGQLAGFISSSASAFKAAGYTGAVTTTEPLSVWQDWNNAGAFCSVVDVVGANLYAFFNADVTADKAGDFIQSEINILEGICSGKAVYVLESGWPHAGNCNGAACPSPENQATALKGIQATAGAQVVFLSYEDEPWKVPGQFGVEQFWGCASVF